MSNKLQCNKKKILIRAAQHPLKEYAPLKSTKKMGGNSGNLLYTHGIARNISTVDQALSYGGFMVHTWSDEEIKQWAHQVNKNYDCYIVPLANIFRADAFLILKNLTKIIALLDIPVIVVGVGAQSTAINYNEKNYKQLPTDATQKLKTNISTQEEHNIAVLKFCRAVLDKSASMGVRGNYTKEYLTSLGIEENKIKVIGCPSLFTWGKNHKILNSNGKDYKGNSKLTESSLISMNIDHRVKLIEKLIQSNIERYCNLTSPCQDARSARMILLKTNQFNIEKINTKLPLHVEHQLYKENKLIYYSNPWGWINDLSKKEFVFGTRLHGNIAGILGGTPSHLIAHDSRTLEIAEYFSIPYSNYNPNSSDHDFYAEDLACKTDYEEFNTKLPNLYDIFTDFLNENNINTIQNQNSTNLINFDQKINILKNIGASHPF